MFVTGRKILRHTSKFENNEYLKLNIMNVETLGVLIPFAFFALVFGVVYISVTTRNKERLALIEKGADPELFKAKAQPESGHKNMKVGLFLIGIALGILAGYFLAGTGMQETPAYFSMIFLFGGIALVVSHYLQKKNPEKEVG